MKYTSMTDEELFRHANHDFSTELEKVLTSRFEEILVRIHKLEEENDDDHVEMEKELENLEEQVADLELENGKLLDRLSKYEKVKY